MKEQIHTIPISDAMANSGECPFCYIEKRVEDHTMDFVLGHGASYMEADIREMTDKSLPQIGRYFGSRHHTTVKYACEKIEDDIKSDETLKNVIESLKEEIKD